MPNFQTFNGKWLYDIYAAELAKTYVAVDTFEDLDEDDKAIWNAVAAKAKRYIDNFN